MHFLILQIKIKSENKIGLEKGKDDSRGTLNYYDW